MYLIRRATVELRQRHCSHAVLDVDGDGLAELHACDVAFGRDEVECYLSVLYLDVLSVEVTFVAAVSVSLYAFTHVRLHLKVCVYDERALWLYELRVVPEALKVSFFGAINVEVVWVCGRDDGHPWAKPVERAVKLVGLYHHVIACV